MRERAGYALARITLGGLGGNPVGVLTAPGGAVNLRGRGSAFLTDFISPSPPLPKGVPPATRGFTLPRVNNKLTA